MDDDLDINVRRTCAINVTNGGTACESRLETAYDSGD